MSFFSSSSYVTLIFFCLCTKARFTLFNQTKEDQDRRQPASEQVSLPRASNFLQAAVCLSGLFAVCSGRFSDCFDSLPSASVGALHLLYLLFAQLFLRTKITSFHIFGIKCANKLHKCWGKQRKKIQQQSIKIKKGIYYWLNTRRLQTPPESQSNKENFKSYPKRYKDNLLFFGNVFDSIC